jgi:hypothetical protein
MIEDDIWKCPPDLNHWTNEGTGLTNFRPEQAPRYRRALETLNDPRFWIEEKPMGGRNPPVGLFSLHMQRDVFDASAFWNIYDNLEPTNPSTVSP